MFLIVLGIVKYRDRKLHQKAKVTEAQINEGTYLIFAAEGGADKLPHNIVEALEEARE